MSVHFEIDAHQGLVRPARIALSPNCDGRTEGVGLDLVVIHGISLPPGEFGSEAIVALFQNTLDCGAHPYYQRLEGLRVSAHVLIRRDGTLIQFVPFHDRAWHAGVSQHNGRERCNDFSVGIELEGTDEIAYTNAQYDSLNALIAALKVAYPSLTHAPIVGHSDIAPGRKTDPGPSFDWARLY